MAARKHYYTRSKKSRDNIWKGKDLYESSETGQNAHSKLQASRQDLVKDVSARHTGITIMSHTVRIEIRGCPLCAIMVPDCQTLDREQSSNFEKRNSRSKLSAATKTQWLFLKTVRKLAITSMIQFLVLIVNCVFLLRINSNLEACNL